jgi:hypothetical protein
MLEMGRVLEWQRAVSRLRGVPRREREHLVQARKGLSLSADLR